MVCRACGEESAEDFNFCPHCGKQQIAHLVCAACGRESADHFNFCPNCGKSAIAGPSVAESSSPSPEVKPVRETATEESPATQRVSINRTHRIGTYVFGAFSVIALLVSLIKGIVPIYLVESAIWAGAAWYWHRMKRHSELAKAIVIVLAGSVAIGEVVEIASQFRSESKQTTVDTSHRLDDLFPRQNPSTDLGQAVKTNGASAASHIADIEKQAVVLFSQKQYKEARPLFEQACNGTDENGLKYAGFDGEIKACNYLGYLYAQGLGGAHDTKKARKVYQKACDQEILPSCASLGSLYQDARDSGNARKYFQKACDGGVAEACGLLSGVQ
jgi:ribosomal protein L32